MQFVEFLKNSFEHLVGGGTGQIYTQGDGSCSGGKKVVCEKLC